MFGPKNLYFTNSDDIDGPESYSITILKENFRCIGMGLDLWLEFLSSLVHTLQLTWHMTLC